MIWRNKDLLTELIIRNLKIKYQRSILGFVWTLLQPAVMAIVLISVFTYVVRIEIENYWAFLISGYFVWNFLQQCLSASSLVFEEHANVIRSIALSKEVLLVGAVLSRFIEFLIELFLVIVILAAAHHRAVPASYAVLPVLFILQLMIAIGLSAPIAILSVFFQDVRYALPLLLMILFYLSPVFYPLSLVPAEYLLLFDINPVARLLDLYHSVLYAGEPVSEFELVSSSLLALAILAIGLLIFSRFKNVLPEVV